ncbi:MAG: SDR family oxidoreductase [Porticoccaceae bacterium]|nr:SDR family oxidoreductase [Pseudomonadales bacterium]MCP5171091.1 SDR family oxidoreductase [Pseudomonadales bacterium]MCP5301670.1 SDR family oxidoreductase [Pseudomonadales bacterium]
MNFKDKTYIVTGGASGVGEAGVTLLAQAGANVVIADLNEEKAENLCASLAAGPGSVTFTKTDVANEDSVINMVNTTVETYGSLDGAFNNAGYPQSSKVAADLSLEEWNKCVGINLTGVFLCIKHELRAMLKSGGGSIVNTASAAGVVAFPQSTEYAAAKHGVCGLTKAVAIDYSSQNIRVNAILPGAIATPMLLEKVAEVPELKTYLESVHPIGRFGQPEEIAQMAIWLLSDLASFVTGSCLSVDGGYVAG